MIFGRQHSPTHCQGEMTLPSLLWGSIEMLCAPFWGSATLPEKILVEINQGRIHSISEVSWIQI
jgi:hypothetical protein